MGFYFLILEFCSVFVFVFAFVFMFLKWFGRERCFFLSAFFGLLLGLISISLLVYSDLKIIISLLILPTILPPTTAPLLLQNFFPISRQWILPRIHICHALEIFDIIFIFICLFVVIFKRVFFLLLWFNFHWSVIRDIIEHTVWLIRWFVPFLIIDT